MSRAIQHPWMDSILSILLLGNFFGDMSHVRAILFFYFLRDELRYHHHGLHQASSRAQGITGIGVWGNMMEGIRTILNARLFGGGISPGAVWNGMDSISPASLRHEGEAVTDNP